MLRSKILCHYAILFNSFLIITFLLEFLILSLAYHIYFPPDFLYRVWLRYIYYISVMLCKICRKSMLLFIIIYNSKVWFWPLTRHDNCADRGLYSCLVLRFYNQIMYSCDQRLKFDELVLRVQPQLYCLRDKSECE